MNFNDLSDKEKKKYLDGFKQYVAERQGKKVESNEVINSVIDDMYNGTNTREKYFNNNATNNNNDNSIWNKVQNTANNNMTNSNPFNGNDILSRRINGQNKTETQNLLNSTSNNNQTFSEELIKSLASIENIGERTNKIKAFVKDKDEQAKLNLKVNEYIQQQESQEEAQKINSDIQQGNYLSSIGHVLKGIPEEAKNSVIDTVAAIQSIAPAPKTSNTANPERLVDAAKIATNKYQDTTSQIDNGVVQTASNISGTIGQMIPSMLANAMIPGSGNLVQAVNVGSDSYLDNLNENQDNKAQSILTGVLKGTTSYGIEKLTGGNFLSGGSLDDIAKKTIKSKVSSNIGRRIASKIYEIGGETLEENLENQAGYVIDKLVNNKDITREQWLNDLGTTSRDTVLTTIVLNLFRLGGNTYKEIQNDEKVDSNTKDLVKKAEKIIKDENLSVDNVNQTRTVETTNSQNNIDNNENVRTDNIFQQQNQNNIDTSNLNFEDSAKAYNLDTNNETIKTVNQVLSNRDISGRFDASYFNNNNENAIWKTSTDENGNTTREVIFNPNGNTQDTMQQISIHELTHDLAGTKEFDELKNLVLDRNKTMQGYTEARQSLENTYSQVYDPNSKEFKSLVDDEEVADTLAQKLGDQDFVNSLSTEKPTVFKRIYDWVVDKVNKITGNKIEKVYWEDIRNKFENAYRQTYQGESNQAKYSIQEDSSGNQYVRVDTDQDIFNGIDKKDYNKIAKMYIQDYLMGKTKLSDNDTAIIDRKSANKYTNPGKRQQNFDKKMKLTPELKNVLEIAQKDSSSLPIKNNSKYRNWEYYNFNFELSGKKFNGTVNIGIDSNGNKHFYEINKIKEVDDISGTSLNRSSASLSNNSITPSQENVNTINKSMQNNENNTLNVPTEKLTEKQRQNRLEYLRNIDTSDMKLLEKTKIKSEIRALENGYNSVEEMRQTEKEQEQKAIREHNDKILKDKKDIPKNSNQSSLNLSKQQQLEIIQKSNPMRDDVHTGIRTVDDIQTFKEAYKTAKKEANDGGWEEYASYPDITNEMIENSLKTGEITVYSSNDIKNGTFVTPSYEQALEYTGNDNSKVKSKKVKVDDVAWINLDEGQYAKISKNNNQSKLSMQQSSTWQEFLDNQIGQRGEGKTVQELKLPTKENINNEKVNSYNVLYRDNEQTSTMNLPVSEGGKVRKHYKSIMQSSNTSPEAKAIAKELMGTDTYVPDSNERQLEIADGRIERNGADNEAVALATKVKNGDRITATDIATGERLIEYYSKIGDKEKLQDSIQNVALAGTQLGQAVQAMSLVNRQTPQGQAVYLQKVIDRMNNDIDKRTKGKGKKFELTPEMIEKITNSSKENLESNIDEVAKELANQVPKTTIEKIDSWRYFSMLGNPKTHIRNILGNLSMASVQTVKNKVAGGLEAIAQKTGMIDKRTKTLKPASRETRKFAKADVDNVMARLNNESKFDAKNLIQQYQRTFKSNLLENTLGKLYNLNSKALEVEDVFGLKKGYRKALADYMTANKLTEADLTAGTREADIQLEKARKYAIEQAQEATFHQQSAMASILNTFENKSTATRLITGAVIPFKKTPINVAKTGASYSPLGLVKSFTLDVANLKNGKITANQYIDNLAKGLTGTGITAVGYALAQAGILSASGDDDDQKNEYYKEDRGNQPFSVTIGDKTYSLDWLAPTAIPLFIGAELNYNIKNADEEQTTEDILDRISNSIDAMSSAMNPMIEMSMLSGLASTIKSFSQGDTQVFQNLAINAGESYINQFFPTLGGQISKIVDDTERSTTSTKKNAFAKAVDSTGKQILNKIPFASQLLPAKTDVWGNTLKRDSNPFYRALQQTTFPWTEKNLKSTNVDNAISDLYEETGEKSVLPNTSINKDFTLNGEKYRMTSEEYAEYKKQYGKNSYNLLNGLTSSKEYKSMNNEQKTEAISKIYEYANEKNKVDYANKKKVDIETSSLYNTVTSIEKEGGKGSDYFKYLGRITGVEKSEEKIKILEETDIPLKSKSSIYTNTVGKSDDFYSNVLKESNININEYLKYKQQKFESDKKDDGTLEGKTVTNSKKKKVYNYVNNMNITYNQKLLILGKQYKLSDSEQKKLYQYINSIPGQTSEEKLEIFKMYTNNFQIYKNGTMSFK